MTTPPSQTSESIIFDGTVGLTTAVVMGLFLAFIAGWLLWRERQSVGSQWASLFWILRMTAIAVALWMLAGPARETIKRSTVTQSIAILTDVSQSMETVDSPDPTEVLRWSIASQLDAEPTALGHCDSIKVATRLASRSQEKANRLLKEHRPLKDVQQALEETSVAADRAILHCEQLITQLADDREDLADRVGRVESLLEGQIVRALEDLELSLENRDPSLMGEITDTLETVAIDLNSASRRMDTITKDIADEFASEGLNDVENSASLTRREKSLNVLDSLQKNVLDNLEEDVRIRKFQFDSMLMPIAAEQTWRDAADIVENTVDTQQQPLTDITAVLEQLSTDRQAQSTRLAILLTDGNHTALGKQAPLEAATQIADLPVYTVPIGSAALVRDIRLHRVEAPSNVVEGDSAIIDAIITAVDCDGLSTEVTLRHDGNEIDRKKVMFIGNRVDRRVQFRVPTDQIGWQDYELTVEPIEDEEGVSNNVAAVSWEVVRDSFRILLADGVSHWEFRYLQQLFRRDTHIECDELLFYPRLRGTGEMADNPRLPERVEDWAVYDVVILGDLGAEQFSTASQESLVEYVRERHGHLILIAGRDHMPREYHGRPLMELLPVDAQVLNTQQEGYTLMLTDEGRLHSALAIEESNKASEAAWLSIYRKKPIFKLSEYSRPKPSARTLLRAVPTRMSVVVDDRSTRDDLPAFLCWHQVGGGRVVYLAAAEIWKLRFRAHDRRHHRFWGQMIRWVTAESLGSGSDLVRLTTDKNHYNPGEPIEITVWLKDQTGRPLAEQQIQVSARILDETIASAELTSDPDVAGRYFGTLENIAQGTYEIAVTGAVVDELLSSTDEKLPVRALVTIDTDNNLEMLDTRCDRALLEQVAEITGGQTVPPTAIAEVLHLASLSPEVNETIRRTPLWNRWSNLWIVVGCLVVEWIVRKRKGLV